MLADALIEASAAVLAQAIALPPKVTSNKGDSTGTTPIG
jgi:hypothetical protein